MKRILLAVGLLACAAGESAPLATIPRYGGHPTYNEAPYVGGNYDPMDAPLAWLPTNEMLIRHMEIYSDDDVSVLTCSGTGFYWVSLATGAVRAAAVGEPACKAAYAFDGVTSDPQGLWIVYSPDVPFTNSHLSRLDLSTQTVETLGSDGSIFYGQPAVSRDGRRIAVRGLDSDEDSDKRYYSRIYISAADGSKLQLVPSSEPVSDYLPAWSPDGRHIVFERSPDEASKQIVEIAVQDVDGRNRRSLTRGSSPAWSPDSQWIAFLGPDSDRRYRTTLRIIRPNGTGERVVFENRERGTYSRGWAPIPEGLPSGPLVWSPDSRWISFTRRFDAGVSVWRVEIASGRLAQITAPDQ